MAHVSPLRRQSNRSMYTHRSFAQLCTAAARVCYNLEQQLWCVQHSLLCIYASVYAYLYTAEWVNGACKRQRFIVSRTFNDIAHNANATDKSDAVSTEPNHIHITSNERTNATSERTQRASHNNPVFFLGPDGGYSWKGGISDFGWEDVAPCWCVVHHNVRVMRIRHSLRTQQPQRKAHTRDENVMIFVCSLTQHKIHRIIVFRDQCLTRLRSCAKLCSRNGYSWKWF